jgi:hypothetical protein
MYDLILVLHSWLRWPALLAGIVATAAAVAARPDASGVAGAERWGKIFTILLDVQFMLGLLLYAVLSPTTRAVFSDFGGAMRDPAARFWAVEHITMMIAAVAIAHIGRVLARKAATPAAKRKRLMFSFAISTLAMLAAIPWPGMRAGRPLFRV